MSRFSIPKPEYKLSDESALAQVRDLLQYYHIDIDSITDKKQRQPIEAACEKLVGYYRQGFLENVRDGAKLSVKQHLQNPPGEVDELLYAHMTGKAKLATDGFDADDRYARIYHMLDVLSGSITGTVEKLIGVDLSVAEDIGVLFLLA